MAKFFQINRFEEAGPGVDKDGPKKKRFFLFWEIVIRKFWKMILLNLLYLLFCLPIVTIGPATAGLVYVLRNFAEEKPVFIWGDFIDAFKKNWKQATGMWVLNMVVLLLLVVAVPFYFELLSQGWFFYIPFIICTGFGIVWFLMNYYTYLMIVSLNLKLKDILKNAFALSSVALKTNLITTFFLGIIIVPLILFIPPTLTIIVPLFLFFGFSFLGLIVCFNSYQHILTYIVNPYYEEHKEEKEELENRISEEVIFEDIGTKEVKVEKKQSGSRKGKTIR